jgi:hypothetical protein
MKKIIKSKTYATMMEHRAAANPNTLYSGRKSWANLKFKFPVFKSGKVSKYVKLLVSFGMTGNTWVNALNELGVKPEKQYSGYFSCYRQSLLNHGLIKKSGRVGRKPKYVLTTLGDRYVSMVLRRTISMAPRRVV